MSAGLLSRLSARTSSLRVRILLSSILAALLAFLLLFLGGQAAVRAGLPVATISPATLAACRAAPEQWVIDDLHGLTVYAYDATTGLSANPTAPPVDPEVIETLRTSGDTRALSAGSSGVHQVRRVGDSGPCSLMVISGRPGPRDPRRLFEALLFIGSLTLGLAVFMSTGLAIRPLTRRVASLARAARGVGAPGYTPILDEHPDELGVIAETLDQAHARIEADRAELVARHEALEAHLAEIAHDLRTPLASLQLSVEALADPERRDQDAAARALADASYLVHLTENLHQGSRLRGGLEPLRDAELLDLGEVVERVVLRFGVLGRPRSIQVAASVPDAPVRVKGDVTLVERALANLVHNAVASVNAGGHVAVLLSRTPEGFRLEVLDDGPGVEPSILPSLATRTFRRDGARRRDPRGGGLGILITNEICQRHGWQIHYKNGADTGLSVVVQGPTGAPDDRL